MATRRTSDSPPAGKPAAAAKSTAPTRAKSSSRLPASAPAPVSTPPAIQTAAPTPPASGKRVMKPKAPPATTSIRAQVTPDKRRAMIAEAAYLRAERRGFGPGGEAEDWVAAEREVDALLSADANAAQ